MLIALLALLLQSSSVEPSKAADKSSTWTSRNGVLEMKNVTLKTAVAAAYGVEERDVYGPSWIDEDRFDIVVKAGSAVPHAEMVRRLRAVLEDRFKLKAHSEERMKDGFALTGGAGLKEVEPGDGPRTNATNEQFVAERASMSRIAGSLGRLLDVPIVDATGLRGVYSFTIEWKDRKGLDAALESVAGLRLEKKIVPVESVVVDRVEKN